MNRLCKDCRHYRAAEEPHHRSGTCGAEIVDPEHGDPIKLDNPLAREIRQHYCGAIGIYWERAGFNAEEKVAAEIAKASPYAVHECPRCHGRGSVETTAGALECNVCGNVGKVTEQKLSWIKQGKALRLRRLDFGVTQVRAARAIRMRLLELCRREEGILDPAPLEKLYRDLS